jgi:hypothetical protein
MTPSTLKVMSESRRLTMARVRAPRALTMSTVRLVSVVVPDWLMAIDQGVGHALAAVPFVQFEPAQFRCLEGAQLDGGIGQVGLEDVGAGLGGHAGGTLAHEKDAPDSVFGEVCLKGAGKGPFVEMDHIMRTIAAVGNFPAIEQGALHRQGGFGDLL